MTCLIPLANGTEEMEAVIMIDMLRRAGIEVIVAGDGDMVTCSRGVRIVPDMAIDDIADDDEFDLIILPGGRQGVQNFLENEALRTILARHRAARKPLGAICAAPLVLHELELLKSGSMVTSHPSIADELKSYKYSMNRVVEDNGIITSRGAGTALEFSLEIIKRFTDEATARRIATDIVMFE